MLNSIVNIVELIAGLGLVIFIHELGHFLAAKLLGIRAERFSLGFGPRLVGFNWGGTDCRLSLIPLGGYVMLPGDSPDDEKSDDPAQLSNRPIWQRATVFSAGVVMNVLLSLVLFAVAFSIGVPFPRALIGQVAPGSPAEAAGLRRGDEIVAINGNRDIDLEEVLMTVAFTDEGEKLDLTVLNDGTERHLDVVPVMDHDKGIPTIGIKAASDTLLMAVDPDGPAAEAGLRKGDRIETLDGLDVFDNSDLSSYIQARPETDITVGLLRDGEHVSTVLRPRAAYTLEAGVLPAEPLVVKLLLADSPAESSGLRPADKILAVNGTPARTMLLVGSIIARNPDKPLEYSIKRGDEQLTFTIAAMRAPCRLQPLAGIAWEPERPATVGALEPGSPLAEAGIRVGDRITVVGGTPVTSWDNFEGLLFVHSVQNKDKSDRVEVKLSWERDGKTASAMVKLKRIKMTYVAEGIGIAVQSFRMRELKCSPYVAPWMGLKKTVVFMKRMYLLVRGIGKGRVAPGKALGGPIRIFQIAYHAAGIGPTYLMHFLAVIGLNLAVINFLPIPFLDGGHVLLMLIENVRGKPLSRRTQEIVTYIGLALILTLVALITFNDIRRLIMGE